MGSLQGMDREEAPDGRWLRVGAAIPIWTPTCRIRIDQIVIREDKLNAIDLVLKKADCRIAICKNRPPQRF